MSQRDWRLEACLRADVRDTCPLCDMESEVGELLGQMFWLCPHHGMVWMMDEQRAGWSAVKRAFLERLRQREERKIEDMKQAGRVADHARADYQE